MKFKRSTLKGILSLLFLISMDLKFLSVRYGSMPLLVVSTSGNSGTYLNCLLSSTTSLGFKLPMACLYCSEVIMNP